MKRKLSIGATAWHCLFYTVRFIPVSKLKHKMCLWILRHRNSLPLYLVVYPGDTAVQVGTPNLITVKRFSRLVGKKGCVVIVEADPGNADKLKKGIEQSNITNVSIVGKGAWSSKTTLLFHKSDDFDGDHKLDVPGICIDNDYRTNYEEQIEIEVDTVDNILHGLEVTDVNYLSITVNGAEEEVLKGCLGLVKDAKNLKIFSKGHARIGDPEAGEPINVPITKYLRENGLMTMLTCGEKSTAGIEEWKVRDGDVFAWKTPSNYIGPK